jgi:putative tryptophan/tyrosine transport system substrate-binding protein
MKRREIFGVLGGAVAWPLAARAQQPAKSPSIAFLGPGAAEWGLYTPPFVQRLRELGWIEGRTIAIEYLWSGGRSDRVSEFAAELVRQNVDIVVTYGRAAMVLKQATTSIPIVSAITVDPVGSGLVASLSHPGGNVTGMSIQAADIAGKRLELLREMVPGLRRLAVMFDAEYPGAALEARNIQAAAGSLGLQVVPYEIRRAEDIPSLIATLRTEADGLSVVETDFIAANGPKIVALALDARLPTSFNERSLVQAGGLMSYGPSYSHLFQRAAEIVDKILRGTKPGDIPVEQPTQFDLVLNLKTAKALGIAIPSGLLAIADEVIE